MINSSLKEKYWDSATDKQMVISVVGTNQKIDNSMLEIGTFALEESLCSDSELKFGACEANCVKFTARNTAGNIIGKTISIEETIDGDSENPMPYGVFKVASDVPTADRTKRQITAYDAMYDIINTDVKAWYAGLSFPMTLKQFRNSFFAHLGIAQVETNLVNDSMTVNKTIVATQTDDSSAVTEEPAISGKMVVTAICEINGCFGNINRDGKFEYVFLKEIVSALYPAEDLFPADNVFPSDANTESMTGNYITFDYEDFQSKAITQLEIKTSEDNAGAVVGTAGNNYSITGNFLVSDKTGAELEQIANNLLPIMAKAEYTPIKSCTCVGNPCLELGEAIRFNTTREVVETYLLQRTLTGVQSKRDSISAQGTQTHSAKVNSIRDTIESVERRTGKLERNADHLQSTYEDLEKQTNSKFEQTADAITAEVTRAQGAEDSLGSRISQTADAIQTEVINRQNADNEMSTQISQSAHSVSISASGSGNTAGITIALYDENGNLIDTEKTANITITGFVSFWDLANAGSTSINGANINTGTISGVTFISNNGTEQVEIEDGNVSFYYNWNKLGRLRTGSFVNADSQLGIMLESISPYLLGVGSGREYYFLIDPSSKQVKFYSGVLFSGTCGFNGYSSFGGTANFYSSVNFAERPTCNGENLALKSEIPSVSGYINSVGSASWDEIGSNNWVVTSFSLNKRGSSIYVSGNHIKKSLSDQRLKEHLGKLDERYADFYKMLNPIIFKFHDDIPTIKGKHFGLYANEVADALDKANIDRSGLRLVWQSDVDLEAHEDRYINDKTWNLDYDELHALHIYMIQNQQKEIEQLKSDNFALKGEVDILKQRLGKMEEMLNVINSKIN